MTGLEIKHDLEKRGQTYASVARGMKPRRTAQYVGMVARGQATGRPAAQAIADALDLPLEAVFPRYLKRAA